MLIRLNKRYKLKIAQSYAPTSRHDDQAVQRFCEDVVSATARVKTQFTVIMGYFIARVGRNQAGYKEFGKYGLGCRTFRGDNNSSVCRNK